MPVEKPGPGFKDLPILDAYDSVEIRKSFPVNLYVVKRPALSPRDAEVVKVLSSLLLRKSSGPDIEFSQITRKEVQDFLEMVHGELDRIPVALLDRLMTFEENKVLAGELTDFLEKTGVVADAGAVASAVAYEVSVYGALAPLLWDDRIEEIVFNKVAEPVYVYHRVHALCKTNVFLSSDAEAKRLIKRLSKFVGRSVDAGYPLLDAHFPDGSRVNATIPPATPRGSSLTIRKFTKQAFTMPDLIRVGTISSDAAAFLWMAVEGFQIHPMNIIVCGNAGAGKTTLTDSLSDFIPARERIVTIEDTLELHLGNRDNWIQTQSVPAYKGSGEVTMDLLVRNSLRMRPDRLIVGEVRGPEAQTLFTAMNLGNRGSMGTLHANSARDLVLRLTSPPMSVPQELIPLLDLVVVQHRLNSKKGMVRRVVEITEVGRMEGKAALNPLFKWDSASDVLRLQGVPSETVQKLALFSGYTKNGVLDELERRRKVLDWLTVQRLKRSDLGRVIEDYYEDKDRVLKKSGQ